MKFPIYLDYSATTPVDPRVAQRMIPFLTEDFGNPASRSHAFGWKTEEAVEEARERKQRLSRHRLRPGRAPGFLDRRRDDGPDGHLGQGCRREIR